VSNSTTLLLGHNRWRTRGDERNNFNNMPLRAGGCLGTHNGTVYNADYLFKRFKLNQESDGLKTIDLGAGHSSSGETLCGRVITALKSQALLTRSP